MGKKIGYFFLCVLLLLSGLPAGAVSEEMPPENHAAAVGPTSWAWHIETVDAPGNVGEYTSLALDDGGLPHIAYYDATNQDLKYAYYDGTSWHIETVDAAGSVGRYASLALSAAGRPRVSYYDDTSRDLKYAERAEPGAANGDSKYAEPKAGGWSVFVIDSVGDVGRYTSLALSGNTPYISYYDAANGDLKVAYWVGSGGNCGGGQWSCVTVWLVGNVGLYTSLALDRNNALHISYYDATNGGLWYIGEYTPGAIILPTLVDAAGDVGQYSSLALDASDRPHIAYYDATNGDPKYAYYDGSTWHIETIDGGPGDNGSHISLALDGSGRPHVSYHNAAGGLSYARRDDAGWHIEPVDSSFQTGFYTSLALDSSGRPHISYYDAANADLKYAYACVEALFSAVPVPQCVWRPVQFDNASRGVPPLSYLWSFGDGITSTLENPVHIYEQAGRYTVRLTATASCGFDRFSSTVVISSTPEADFTFGPLPVCVERTVRFTNTTVGSPTLSYFWSFGDGSFSNLENPTHTYTLSGTRNVRLIAMNNCDVDVQTYQVQIHTDPAVGLSWLPSVPEVGLPVTFTAHATSTLPVVAYEWSFGDGGYGSGEMVTHTYAATGTYTVILTATNGCGPGRAQADLTVVCYPPSGADFSWTPISPTVGERVTFTGTVEAGTPPFTYTWAFGDGETGSGPAVTHTYSAAAFYTVLMTATNYCGQEAAAHTVQVGAPPAAGFESSSPVCLGEETVFTNTTSGTPPITYLWDFGDGITSTLENPVHTYAAAGEYTVTLTAANAWGSSVYAAPVAVLPLPEASFIYRPSAGYYPLTVAFTDTSRYAQNPTWAFGDGGTASGAVVTHTYTTDGDFTVTLTVESIYGCGTDAYTATVHVAAPGLPIAGFEESSPDCLGATTFFTNTTVVTGPAAYLWNFGDGITSTLENPVHTYAAAGTYTVWLTATNAQGSDSISRDVVILAAPSGADFAWAPITPTVGERVTFTGTVEAGTPPFTYTWDFGDGEAGSGPAVTHTYSAAGTYTVRMTAANACGETYAAHAVVVVVPPCEAPSGADFVWTPITPTVGERVTFTGTVESGSGPLAWGWDFGDDSAFVYGPAVVSHTYTAAGAYTAMAAVWNGCGIAYASHTLTVLAPSPHVYRIYLPLVARGYCGGDIFEPDDTPEQARSILLGVSQRHNFGRPWDEDWTYIELQAGRSYRFRTENLSGGADTRLYLYRDGQYGTPVAQNDDWASGNCRGTPPDPLQSCFVYTPDAGGIYRLKAVQVNGGFVWGCAVEYTLSASEE